MTPGEGQRKKRWRAVYFVREKGVGVGFDVSVVMFRVFCVFLMFGDCLFEFV